MPTTMLGAANATGLCPVETCRGHLEPRRISAQLKVKYWTQRIGAGPITVSRVERDPIVVTDEAKTCEHCGSELSLGEFTNGGGPARGPVQQKNGRVAPRIQPSHTLTWPQPRVAPDTLPDEILPAPADDRTLDERVKYLERHALNHKRP